MSESYARVSDPKVADTLVKRTAKSYRTAAGKVRNLTADAAYATECAYSAGLIGKDATYPTARDYAATYDVAPATVTLWKRLGRALVVGVTTDSPVWQVLAFKAAANDKAVADAIMADDATVETITAAIATTREPDGKRRTAAKDGKPNDGTTDAPTDVLAGVTDPTDQAMILVGMLDKIVKGTDREGWAKIESALDKIVKREVTVRAKADKAAAAA